MIKCRLENDDRKYISSKDMALGDVGVVQQDEGASSYVGHVVLQTYNLLVSLTDPQVNWSDSEFKVELLRKGAKVTLEVE